MSFSSSWLCVVPALCLDTYMPPQTRLQVPRHSFVVMVQTECKQVFTWSPCKDPHKQCGCWSNAFEFRVWALMCLVQEPHDMAKPCMKWWVTLAPRDPHWQMTLLVCTRQLLWHSLMCYQLFYWGRDLYARNVHYPQSFPKGVSFQLHGERQAGPCFSFKEEWSSATTEALSSCIFVSSRAKSPWPYHEAEPWILNDLVAQIQALWFRRAVK